MNFKSINQNLQMNFSSTSLKCQNLHYNQKEVGRKNHIPNQISRHLDFHDHQDLLDGNYQISKIWLKNQVSRLLIAWISIKNSEKSNLKSEKNSNLSYLNKTQKNSS